MESAMPVDTNIGALISVIEKDGSVSAEFEFASADGQRKTLGKANADINFFDEAYLSDEHAALDWKSGVLWLTDLNTKNGVYVRIRTSMELQDEDTFLAGEQMFAFERNDGKASNRKPTASSTQYNGTPLPAWTFRIRQIFTGGIVGAAWPVFSNKFVIGREGGDAVFHDDRFMSRAHCAVIKKGDQFHLSDQKSRNGTYLRIRDAHRVQNGDYLRLGDRLLRVTYQS